MDSLRVLCCGFPELLPKLGERKQANSYRDTARETDELPPDSHWRPVAIVELPGSGCLVPFIAGRRNCHKLGRSVPMVCHHYLKSLSAYLSYQGLWKNQSAKVVVRLDLEVVEFISILSGHPHLGKWISRYKTKQQRYRETVVFS